MDFERQINEMKSKNKKYLDEFKKWLKDKGLKSKTINNHVDNVNFYINKYLNYYEITPMEKGTYMIDDYLRDWFVRKCLWSTASSIKKTAASIKKFYQCMCEKGYVKEEDYKLLCFTIKENMDIWIENVEDYNNESWDFF